MRDIILHQYDNIDYYVIHAAATLEVPGLLAAARAIQSTFLSDANGI